TGKTALKVFLGKYMMAQGLTFAQNSNPSALVSATAQGTLEDKNQHFVPDCDFHNPLANEECGALTNNKFGTPVVTTTYGQDVLTGWGARPYNWQGSGALPQGLRPGIALTIGYFRTTWGNITVTDNQAVTPAD